MKSMVDRLATAILTVLFCTSKATVSSAAAGNCSAGASQPGAWLLPGFCSQVLPVAIQQPRTILASSSTTTSLPDNSLLVLERGTQSVVLLTDSNGDSLPDTYQTLITLSGLNHGLAVDSDRFYFYASTPDAVYRWTIYNGTGAEANSQAWATLDGPVEVITKMSALENGTLAAGHSTRTLALDATGTYLYVSVGSADNVDHDSYRSRVRKVDVSNASLFPIDFASAPVHADGLRNEVGLAFDAYGTLWGVENGADKLYRSDLGGDIHQDNPAEELNRLDGSDKHFGYPYCWTEYNLPEGLGRGTVWAWPSTDLGSVTYTDAECRNTSRFQGPEVAMQGHSAPLGITFYRYVPDSQLPAECAGGSFPSWMDGFAFVTFHGSWNRDVPTGYKVVYIEMKDGRATSQPIDLLRHNGANATWPDEFRPVSVDFDRCGRLYVSSDGKGSGSKIVRIDYYGATTPTPAPVNGSCGDKNETCGRGDSSKSPVPVSPAVWMSSILATPTLIFLSNKT